MSADEVRLALISGAELPRWLDGLARLRIEVFRDWPYLYDGSAEYEAGYLTTYAATPGAVIVGAFAGERLIGASTGLPMAGEPDNVTAPLRAAGYAIERLFYFGESVLEKGWRGRGIGVRFFAEREAWARRLGGFDHTLFCAVQRPADHPLRPADYVPLDRFWERRGYARLPGLTCAFVWKDVDQPAATAKPMAYWIKAL